MKKRKLNDYGREAVNRPYFTPSPVDLQLERSQRRCVQACLAKLGIHQKMGDGPQRVLWWNILQLVSPNGMEVHAFTDWKDLKDRAGDSLCKLYVAVVNQVVGITNHAMLLWRHKSVALEQFVLFSPGSHTTEKNINIDNERDVAGWSWICAAFIPGTVIRKRDSVSIELT